MRPDRSRLAIVLATITTLSLAAAATAADFTVVSRTTGDGAGDGSQTQYVTDGKVRTSTSEMDHIIDYDAQKLLWVDHDEKEWSETTVEAMRQQFAELEEMIDSNPIMARMMGGADEVEVRRTGQTAEIAGHATDEIVLTLGDGMTMTMWVAPGLATPATYYEARKMAYAAMGPTGSRFQKLFDAMAEIDGFPLRTDTDVSIMGFSMSSSTEAVEVRDGVPADAFALPAGYKQGKPPFGR